MSGLVMELQLMDLADAPMLCSHFLEVTSEEQELAQRLSLQG